MRALCKPLATVALAASLALPAHALVNPQLQPIDLYERFNAVVALRVTAIDDEARTVTLAVTRICKGRFAPREVVIALAEDDEKVRTAFEELIWEGQTLVAFVGKPRRTHEGELLFYAGSGRWQVGALERLDDMSAWRWTEDLGNGDMFGTFNGAAERLVEMMSDMARGRYYHPAVPLCQFRPDLEIDTLPRPVRGVALYDVDGDGDLDVYACSEGGDRAYLQTSPLKFTDSTAELGLAGLASASVSFADVNGDGRADLLAGGAIRLGENKGFARSALLPAAAGENLKCAAFVELNGDGWPDVVISKAGGGLTAWLNQGGRFVEATARLGLDSDDCGAGGNGFFFAGDWNGDGRTDIFYAVRKGLLLLQDEQGRFSPSPHRLQFDFKTGGDSQGLTGAGCFAPLWRPDGPDLIFSSEASVNFVVNVEGQMQDMSGYGNEITETSFGLLPVVAEDLNADGNVDLYAGSRLAVPNMLYTNRGYGSFMTPHKYKPEAFPGAAHQKGAWGVAAGDVDGDGANDILLGAPDGRLTLMMNDTLSLRQPKEHAAYHDRKLEGAKIVSVRVSGKRGVVGADVRVVDASGEVAGRRVIGANIATGCRGPDTVNLVVREPGPYEVRVRYSDGFERVWPVDLSGGGRRTLLEADRDAPAPAMPAASAGPAGGDAAPANNPFPGWGYAVAAGAVALAALLVGFAIRRRRTSRGRPPG